MITLTDIFTDTDYRVADFQRDFRVITENNKELVREAEDFKNGEEDDILGMLIDVSGNEEEYAKLRKTPINIWESRNAEETEIYWVMHTNNTPRIYPHSIKEYMEPEGEGMTQLSKKDYDLMCQVL